MFSDVSSLREFYTSPLGKASQKSIGLSLSSMWGECKNERLLGIGYSIPWLDRFSTEANTSINFMPAAQGAIHWPVGKDSATALIFEEELPLPDSSIDRIVITHLLEHCENPQETLKEIWRVLAPNGKLFVVVPNRRGIWARLEHTPFGTGRPFSRGQLSDLLSSVMLSPNAWSDALHFPPGKKDRPPRFHENFEKFGRRWWPLFAGAIIVEASKKLYQGIPAITRQSRRVFVPVLAPQGSPQTYRQESFDLRPELE